MSMSAKPNRSESTGPQSIPTLATETGQSSMGNTTREEEIRRRAYEINLERGHQPGGELDDCGPWRRNSAGRPGNLVPCE